MQIKLRKEWLKKKLRKEWKDEFVCTRRDNKLARISVDPIHI
jgi:hypothetical protein